MAGHFSREAPADDAVADAEWVNGLPTGQVVVHTVYYTHMRCNVSMVPSHLDRVKSCQKLRIVNSGD